MSEMSNDQTWFTATQSTIKFNNGFTVTLTTTLSKNNSNELTTPQATNFTIKNSNELISTQATIRMLKGTRYATF